MQGAWDEAAGGGRSLWRAFGTAELAWAAEGRRAAQARFQVLTFIPNLPPGSRLLPYLRRRVPLAWDAQL